MNKQRLVNLLALALALGISSTDIYLSSLPKMAVQFGVSADIINLTVSQYSLGLAIGCLGCGFFSDRYGRRTVYLVNCALYALVSLAIAIVPQLYVIIALRFIQGALTAVFVIVSRQILLIAVMRVSRCITQRCCQSGLCCRLR